MSYYCPHCHKLSDTPDGLALAGFHIMCGYCRERFEVPQDETAQDEAKNHEDGYAVSCPACDVRMHLSKAEYDILQDHKILCPRCETSLKLPTLSHSNAMHAPQKIKTDKNGASLASVFILSLIIIASFALLFTPQGQEVISDLSQKFAHWRTGIWHIKSQWHEFTAFLQGFFL